MAFAATLDAVKLALRISHDQLDEDISQCIDACMADLRICGVQDPDESDPAILAEIKLYCRAQYTDDTDRAAAFMDRYNAMKGTLQIAAGYGGAPDD